MNTENNNDGIMYRAAAFGIFIVLVTLIILIAVSTAKDAADAADDRESAPDHSGETIHTPDTDPPSGSDTSEPEVTDPPATDPPVTDPPATDPPATDPPVTTPPVTDPPVTTPPVTDPPVTDPPVQPPVPDASYMEELEAFYAKYPDTVLKQTADAGQAYIDKMVFLGDSTTYGLKYYAMLNGGKKTTQVWTPESGTLTLSQASFATIVYPETGEQITIEEAVRRKKPEYLVITLGVNGVSFMTEESYFKSEYKKVIQIVQKASPETKIICQSIFPVCADYKLVNSINRDKIDRANRWIVEAAAECGVKFIDTNSVLRDAGGWLPTKYSNGDGIHLNPTGFTLELNNLRTHAWPDQE